MSAKSRGGGRRKTTETYKESKNPLVRWRQRRRLMRESRLLVKEARRILRKYRSRISEELRDDVNGSIKALKEARQERNYRRVRERAERLDEMLEKKLVFGRKSAIREYTESIGVAVLIALLLRAFVVEAFKIPSGSMIPTLKVGDHIFVNKFVYGLRIPWTEIKFFEQKPQRGTVVVFIYPGDKDKDFIKRIIAVGGDTVAVRDGQIYINKKAVKRRRLEGECQFVDGDENTPIWEIRPCVAYEEELGGHHYRVIQNVHGPTAPDFKEIKVPEGHVFVMGDNRDNSHDSRAWEDKYHRSQPFVPLRLIKGKALIIWWSSGEPDGVRWRRFFDAVHKEPVGEDVVP